MQCSVQWTDGRCKGWEWRNEQSARCVYEKERERERETKWKHTRTRCSIICDVWRWWLCTKLKVIRVLVYKCVQIVYNQDSSIQSVDRTATAPFAQIFVKNRWYPLVGDIHLHFASHFMFDYIKWVLELCPVYTFLDPIFH